MPQEYSQPRPRVKTADGFSNELWRVPVGVNVYTTWPKPGVEGLFEKVLW